jgi:alkylation response protein AidB-like acyl-CoA dehydrogenase
MNARSSHDSARVEAFAIHLIRSRGAALREAASRTGEDLASPRDSNRHEAMKTPTTTDWTDLAREIGPGLEEASSRHDIEGTFVSEGYQTLKRHRFFSALVPAELGGGGASLEELCAAIRVLGRHCPATALSFSMHSHLVAATVWRVRQGKPGEALLRRIAEEQLVLVSTGATDWVNSNGEMTRVDGGYKVGARKVFASGSPGADLMVTSSRFEDRVLHFTVPFDAEGVRILDDWDTLGMRGTGSNTVLLEDVFVPDEAVSLERPQDEWHVAWTVAVTVALPILMSPYVGVAEKAAELAREGARHKAGEPHMPYLLGELENELATARMAWRDMVRNAAEYEFPPVVHTADAALVGKTICTKAAVATVEKAMEVSGGRGFFRGNELQRLLRDVHASAYHPLPEKKQLLFTGRLALGLDPVS